MEINATSPYEDQEDVTGMSLGLAFREAGNIVRLMLLDGREPQTLEERIKIVLDCQEEFNKKVLSNYNSASPISWAAQTISRLVIYKAWLLVNYPLSSQDWTAMETIVRREDLLLTSTMVLELTHKLQTNGDMKQWRWLFGTYIQWRALAVTLVELCVQDPSPLKDKAWAVVDILYEPWSQRVVDTGAGYVWLPIKKLHAKAHAIKVSDASDLLLLHENGDSMPTSLPAHGDDNDHSLVDCTIVSGHGFRRDSTHRLDEWALDHTLALDLTRSDLDIGSFELGSWDFAPIQQHPGDPSPHANWPDWDEFMQDTNGSLQHEFMPRFF